MGKAERKKQILEGAARLFSSRRFDEVLMDDIAQEAGVAKGTLYSHFPDKEELYFAVVFEGIFRLNEQLQIKASKQIGPEEKLRKMIRAIVSFLRKNCFFFKLMSIEDSANEGGKGMNRQRWHEERRKQMEAIETVLQSGAEEGLFEIRDLKTEACILRSMVRPVVLYSEKGTSVDEMVDMIMRIFLRGIRKTD